MNRSELKRFSLTQGSTYTYSSMKGLLFNLAVFALLSVLVSCHPSTNEEKLNFLIIMADDCTMRDVEVYGGQAKTPNLMELSKESMVFENCFQATAMCSPTRQNLLTGLYPVRNGAFRNHSKVKTGTKSVVQYLKSEYDLWFTGKRHIGPKEVFDFNYSKNASDPDPHFIDSVLNISIKEKKPFALYAMCSSPHVPYTKGDSTDYPSANLQLPVRWIDTPETRSIYAKYLAEITYFDSQVGEILAILDKKGLKDNTMVMVLGEHGSLFPFEKWTCYDDGLRSMLLVRYPQKVEPSRNHALIEYTDILPTMLDFAQINYADSAIDGKSFRGVLEEKQENHKEYVFGIQTTIGINLAKDPYAIRSVRDEKYKYIRNLFPENNFSNAVLADPNIWNKRRQQYLGWMSTWKEKALVDSAASGVIKSYVKRPYEELYDVENDPDELFNLAENPLMLPVKHRLSDRLDTWMLEQGDKGRETELNE